MTDDRKPKLTVIEGNKRNNADQLRVNFKRHNSVTKWLGKKIGQEHNAITFFACLFCYIEKQTNKITASFEEIAKEEEISTKYLSKLIPKLEEIKAILPSKNKSEYLLNPWIANAFDESNFYEVISLFPDIDIPK